MPSTRVEQLSYGLKFTPGPMTKDVAKMLYSNIRVAAAFLQQHWRHLLNKPSPYLGDQKQAPRQKGQVLYVQDVKSPWLWRRNIVRVSAPGEPPRYRTRRLINSIRIEELGPLTVKVGTDVKYGWKFLEEGFRSSRGGVWVPPRPWFRRGYREMEPMIYRLLLRRI